MICVTDNFCSISYTCQIRSFHLYTLNYLESGYNKEHGKKEKIYRYLVVDKKPARSCSTKYIVSNE